MAPLRAQTPPGAPRGESSIADTLKDTTQEENEDWHAGQEVSATLRGSTDVYEVVVVATFGEVRQKHLHGPDTMVHPFWLFLLMVPVLMVQTTVLVYLKLDYNLAQPVYRVSASPEKDKLLADLKIMMIITVQATMFSKILGNLRVLVFLLNPEVWEQVERPWPEKVARRYSHVAWAYHCAFVAPWAILSIMLHIILYYNICVDSVSIIFCAQGMKEAVYDSLAITFLADLGDQWWNVAAMVLHMYANPEFEFRPAPPEEVQQRCRQDSRLLRKVKALWPSGKRGKRLRKGVTTSLMLFICVRQAYVVAMAVDTDVLPVARDICSWWRFNNGREREEMEVAKQLFTFVEHVLVFSSPEEAIDSVADPNWTTSAPFPAPGAWSQWPPAWPPAPLPTAAPARRLLGGRGSAGSGGSSAGGRASVAGFASVMTEAGAVTSVFDCHNDKYDPLGWRTVRTLPFEHPWGTAKVIGVILAVMAAQVWYHSNQQIMQVFLRRPSVRGAQQSNVVEEKEPLFTVKEQKDVESACLLSSEAGAKMAQPVRLSTPSTLYCSEGQPDLRQELDDLYQRFTQTVGEQARAHRRQLEEQAALHRKQLEAEQRLREELERGFSLKVKELEQRLKAQEGKRRRVS